jgi:peptidoglycan/xylan/chitin deacetylase (PgdA/CDA1 family)
VLVYHQIGPGSGDPRRHLVPQLDLELFRAQLAYLTRRYELVSLKQLRERIAVRTRGDRLPIALTFDDDLPAHSKYAVPLLKEAGAPATFFLTGASLHGQGSFWWQDLQSVADRGGQAWTDLVRVLDSSGRLIPEQTSVHSLAHRIESMAPQARARADARIRAAADPSPADGCMSSDEIMRVARSGFEIGFHTLRHQNLQTLSDEQLGRALTEGLDDFRALTGHRPTSIAYPHCRADLRIAKAARAAGFTLGCVCDGGAVQANDRPLLIDRIDAWSDSIGSFVLKLARAVARKA